MKKILWMMAISVLAIGIGVGWFWLFPDPYVARGRELFVKYCASCHGIKGRGDGFNATYLDPHPRDLTDSIEPYMAEATHEDIFTAISYGVAGIAPVEGGEGHKHVHQHGDSDENGGATEDEEDEAQGSPLMPYWGYTLSDQEIWSLVAYIRTLHDYEGEPLRIPEDVKTEHPRWPVIKPDEFEALAQQNIQKADHLIQDGREAYRKYGCDGCHEIQGHGGKVGPNLDHVGFMLQPQFIFRWITNPQSLKPDTKMPNLRVSQEEALAITFFLSSLKEEPQEGENDAS